MLASGAQIWYPVHRIRWNKCIEREKYPQDFRSREDASPAESVSGGIAAKCTREQAVPTGFPKYGGTFPALRVKG